MIEFIHALVTEKLREKRLFNCVDIALDKEKLRFVVTLRSRMTLKLSRCSIKAECSEEVEDLKLSQAECSLDSSTEKRLQHPMKIELDDIEMNTDGSDSELTNADPLVWEDSQYLSGIIYSHTRVEDETETQIPRAEDPAETQTPRVEDEAETQIPRVEDKTETQIPTTVKTRKSNRGTKRMPIQEQIADQYVKFAARKAAERKRPKFSRKKKIMKESLSQKLYCDKCSFSCDKSIQLQYHTIIHHTSEKPYKCNLCSFAGKFRINLTTHMRRVHEHCEETLQCPQCSYTSPFKENLRTHIHTVHGAKSFQCHLCPKSFCKKHQLTKHQVRVHQNIRNHQCPDCDKAYFTNWHLLKHMWVHTGKKLFPCRICGMQFSRGSNYRRHFHRHHPESPPFFCDMCKFASDDLRSFTLHKLKLEHMRQHEKLEVSKTWELPENGPVSVTV